MLQNIIKEDDERGKSMLNKKGGVFFQTNLVYISKINSFINNKSCNTLLNM